MPVKWFRFYLKRLEEVAERQQAAAKGQHYVPKSELSPQKIEQQNNRIIQARAQLGDGEFEDSLYSD